MNCYYKQYYKEHSKEKIAYINDWNKNNKKKLLLYHKKYQKEYRKTHGYKNRHTEQRMKLLQLLGNKCIRCGFSDSRALQFDHIDDDGYLDKINLKSTRGMMYFYYRNPEIAKKKLQIMCANCNWIKRFENNTHN